MQKVRCKFGGIVISAAGYDAQCELLEIEFQQDGQVVQYSAVPENTWYQFRGDTNPEAFFHRHIKGHYLEQIILPENDTVFEKNK